MTLTLSFLGSPRAEVDGDPIEVDTRKATALLAYVSVTGEAHRRDALAALLWPDYAQERARAALRRTISTLRRALGGRWLVAEREAVGLDPTDVWLDIAASRALVGESAGHGHPPTDACRRCIEPLSGAVALHRGDFLEGFSLRDSEGFDDWQFFQAEGIRGELSAALERLSSALAEAGEFESATDHARRWVALDPLHEPAHRQLMRLYAWAGRRGAALRQYRECVAILDRELGVTPLDETTELYRAIAEDRLAALRPPERPGSRRAAGAAAPAERYPLVGRAVEWATLAEAYERVETDGRVVVVEGEAGIGKTRLAEEFLEHAAARGARAVVVRAYRAEGDPAYGPFVEAIRIAVDEDLRSRVPVGWLSEAGRLVPELSPPGAPPPPPLDRPAAEAAFLESVTGIILRALEGPPPGVLLFDDAHWADEASLQLLARLVHRLDGHPGFLIVTWRSEEVPPAHPLRRLIAEAERSAAGLRLELEPLGLSDVETLVAAAGGLADQSKRLYEETEGVPFFVVEYLKAAGDREGDRSWAVPSGVLELLRSRLGDLSEPARQVLTASAVIGRSFDYATVRSASGRGDQETTEALEELTLRGLIREVGGGPEAPAYDFTHDMVRRIVYEEAGLARRRLLHARVAEALARSRAEERRKAGLIAEHYRLAGREPEAARFFVRAGEHARALYANAEALSCFGAALALGHPNAGSLHEAIADLRTLRGEYAAALASYEAAAAESGPESLGSIEHKIANVYHRRGDWELADSHFRDALDALENRGGDAERARILADRSLTALHLHEAGEPMKLAEGALRLADVAGDPAALAQAHNIIGILAKNEGRLEDARRHLERSLDLATGVTDPGARVAALNNLALALRASGDADEALALTREALALCTSQGDRHREAALHNNLADLLHATGRSEEAMEELKRAVAIFAEVGEDSGGMQPEIWKLVEW